MTNFLDWTRVLVRYRTKPLAFAPGILATSRFQGVSGHSLPRRFSRASTGTYVHIVRCDNLSTLRQSLISC